MDLHLVVNPAAASGKAANRVGATIALLRTHDCVVELHLPESAADAQATIAGFGEQGAERVVVLGGDGLVHQAVNALVGTDTILGIISAGTGNDAVTGLGLPHDLDQACAAALAPPTPIDLIESDAGHAITVATLGFSVSVNERADAMRFPRGAARYTIASLVELPRLDTHALTLVLDGVAHEVEANVVAVANTAYFGGGMKVAPDADPNDGLLDVVVMGPASRLMFAGLLPTVFSGRHVKNKRVSVHRAAQVDIEGADLALRADGEPFGRLGASLKVRPGSLLVAGVDSAGRVEVE